MTILAVLTLPPLQYFYLTTESTLLQSQLLQEINYAREAAHARKLPIGVSHSNNQPTLIFIDEYKNGLIQNKKQIIQVVSHINYQGELHFRSYPSYRHYLLFLPAGFSGENGTFWYCQHENAKPSWAMILNQAGRVRVQYPSKDGVIKDGRGQNLLC